MPFDFSFDFHILQKSEVNADRSYCCLLREDEASFEAGIRVGEYL